MRLRVCLLTWAGASATSVMVFSKARPISTVAAIFRVAIRPERTGNAGKWRETVRRRVLMARVIAVVPAQRSITSVGIPFEPGSKTVSEPNQNGEHDRNHGWGPLADTRTR